MSAPQEPTETDPIAIATPDGQSPRTPERPAKPYRWGFFSASAMILFLMIVGQAVGVMATSFASGGSLVLKDYLALGFLLMAGSYLFMQRAAVLRFFRTMQVGVALVCMSLIATGVGVLVPQIDGFEDPDQRVTQENYEDQYRQFAWAEGYFLYHMMHLYGIGMPEADIPPQAQEGLERFARVYGTEEGDNRRKQMEASFTGGAKTEEIRDFIYRNDARMRSFFDVCTALHLNRTYKSYWFATLLTLLGIGVFFNTFRYPLGVLLSSKKIGFFVTHVGIMTMLAGGGLSKWKTDRGILHLDLRARPEAEYWRHFDREKIGVMPFYVGLDRFARKDWRQIEVTFLDRQFTSRPPQYTLWPGRQIDFDYAEDADGVLQPRVRLKVLELHDKARVDTPRFWELEEGEPGGMGPLVALKVPDWERIRAHGHEGPSGDVDTTTLYRKPDWPERHYFDPLWQFRLLTFFGPLEEVSELFPSTDASFASLSIRGRGDVQGLRLPVSVGQVIELGEGIEVEIQEAVPNFRLDPDLRVPIIDPKPVAEQYPANPGLWVNITGPDGLEERRLVLERLDAEEHDLQGKFTFGDLVIKLEWQPWASPGPPRYVLHWDADGNRTLVSEAGESVAVETGEALPLPGDNPVIPDTFFANARYEKTVSFVGRAPLEDGFDVDFYAPDPAGLRLEVTTMPGTSEESVEIVNMAATDSGLANVWTDREERVGIRFFENERIFPFEWRSVLSIYRETPDGALNSRGMPQLERVELGPESQREIRVNDYFYHRGYRFFQTNAIPELPTYSGIGVVYDPGIPIVLAGMYIIILGTLLAFIVRPIADGRSRKRSGTRGVTT